MEQTESDVTTSLLKIYVFFMLMFQTVFKLYDTAMSTLLLFLATFFKTLNCTFQIVQNFVSRLPHKVHSARILASGSNSNSGRYIHSSSMYVVQIVMPCIHMKSAL